jgi:hypothetical protein
MNDEIRKNLIDMLQAAEGGKTEVSMLLRTEIICET